MRQSSYLPPETATPLTLLSVPGPIVQQYDPETTVRDAVNTVSPDALVAVHPDATFATQRLQHSAERPVLAPQRGMRYRTVASDDRSVLLVATPTPQALPPSPVELGVSLSDVRVIYVLSSALDLRVDPHRRQTAIDGFDDYVDQLPAAWLTPPEGRPGIAEIVHASTALRAGFTTEKEISRTGATASIVGVGTSTSRLGAAVDTTTHDLSAVTLHANGLVTADSLRPGDFGIRAIEQVGPARAESLRSEGIRQVGEAATLSTGELANVLDVGRSTARTISASIAALASGEVVRTTTESLPDADPVFIDIETDGLSGSTAWLVGVLDGDAETGSYYPFRQRSPNEPAAHLEAFAMWLKSVPRDRPIVAWNGYGFDFDILSQQFREHCPAHLDEWESRRTVDPLYWARDRENAVLPGRSNELPHVASALGWEPESSGIDGAVVASVYSRWRDRMQSAADPAAVPQPDWDRLETYCEDDVRALAAIYEAIEAAPVEPATSNQAPDQLTQQGSLSDFT